MGLLLMVYTLPYGSQFVMLYPFRVPTDTQEKSWLKFANSMFVFVRSTIGLSDGNWL